MKGWIRALLLALALCLPVCGASLAEETPYTMRLVAGTEIYRGPGQDFAIAETLEQNGVFTIVQEQSDDEGRVWGRLKSGAGWVLLREAADGRIPYTLPLRAWTPLHPEPGYDTDCTRILGEDGVFTIVEEQLDGEGSLWGLLKSGAGWIDLTYVREAGEPPLTACHAGAAPLEPGNHSVFTAEASEYITFIALRANEPISALRLTALEMTDEGYEPAGTLHELPQLEEDAYLVIGVVFYGDMTAYGVSFSDASGTAHDCMITLSGRNGGVVMTRRVP